MELDKFTYIDFFSGCGGLSEGFNASNKFEGLAHVEWELPMVNTLRNRLIKKWNHTEENSFKKVIHFDIQKTSELLYGNWSSESINLFGKTNHSLIIKNGIKGLIGKKKVDLIIGGPPCQAYSLVGRAQDKNSMQNDYRNFLFESFVKVVEEFTPKIFVFENVPGLLSACPGGIKITNRIFSAFENIGYEIRKPELFKNSLYSSSDFGVPQNRNRIIIIGIKHNSKIILEEIYSNIDKLKSKEKTKTVKDAIKKLPKYIPKNTKDLESKKNESHKLVGNRIIKFHDCRFHNKRDIEIFKTWINYNYNNRSSDEKILFYNKIFKKKSKIVKYRNLEWDKASPTIVAHLHKDGLMFIHPDPLQARSITVKEAAILQSFPDDFEFLGKSGYNYKMIGNAVPPEMAKNIALAISKTLK
jgi:DNA (cytosine-5)-methyltransferase 1